MRTFIDFWHDLCFGFLPVGALFFILGAVAFEGCLRR